jgi:hypothetical protein
LCFRTTAWLVGNGFFAEQPGADAMVGSGGTGVVAHHLTSDAFDAFGHSDAARRETSGERVGLAEPAPAMTSSSAAASWQK